ncbi:MAG: Uncharacterized protein JWM53_6350 [bacterium]|nr:Uncharacterized protein [bacterium]
MTMSSTRPRRWSDRRVAGALAAVALVKGLFWIALLPTFKIADEPTHFENIQFRGEYFEAPHSETAEPLGTTVHAGSPADVHLAWQRSNELFRGRYVDGVRSVHEEQLLREMASDATTRRGSGRLTSANYPGFYYNAAVPVYEAFRRVSLLTRLAAVRLVSLLFGIIAVVATFFAARLIMDSRPLAVAAALVVMLQPMESQMTAAVNNDAGVIGLAAVLFYLQVRFLVRAPEIPKLRWGIVMALAAGGIVFTKPHGFAMLPGCAFTCAWIVAKNVRSRQAWIFASVTAAVAGVFVIAAVFHMREHGQTAVLASPSGGAATIPPSASADYLKFLGQLDDAYKLYLFRSFFGQFAWMEFSLPGYWLDLIRLVWSLVQFGVVAVVVARVVRFPGSDWLSIGGFLLAAFTAAFTVAFILYAEYRFRLLGVRGVIQGRNLLFGLPALAVVAAASYGALVPKRFRTLSAFALATSAFGLHLGSVLCIFRNYYGS